MLKKLITTLLIAFLLQGCATPFARFYYDRTGSVDLTKVPSVVLPIISLSAIPAVAFSLVIYYAQRFNVPTHLAPTLL